MVMYCDALVRTIMRTTSRTHQYAGDTYPVKRGHAPQISISDDNHHVTEAIGDMYGDHHYGDSGARPLSFLPSPRSNGFEHTGQTQQNSYSEPPQAFVARAPLSRTISNERTSPVAMGQDYLRRMRSNSIGRDTGALSPPLPMGAHSPSDTANSSFPLNDIDYESNPAAVTQELSNIQTLRRMSMDVNRDTVDFPTFSSNLSMPNVAPSGNADEDDPARLYWVPASVHPELAPKQFQSFLNSRVNAIRRRSGDSTLSVNDPARQGSSGGLRRKKSMLSRQIDNSEGKGADGYLDGAERLDRKRSLSGQEVPNTGIPNLQELEVLVNDPAKVIQRLSLDAEQNAPGGEVPATEDMPILPAAPPSNSLRRSTRTTYRRGSLRKGERAPFPKRVTKASDADSDDVPPSPTVSIGENLDLTKAHTELTPLMEKPPENFSRPARLNRGRITPSGSSTSLPDSTSAPQTSLQATDRTNPPVNPLPRHFVSQIASNGRSTLQPPVLSKTIPQIVETPPPVEGTRPTPPPLLHKAQLPDRKSSHETPLSMPAQYSGSSALRGAKRPGLSRQNQSEKGNQTLREMAAHPSPLPGNSTRTDSLSFIPTLTEDKKIEVKKGSSKKDANDGTRKSSWSWGAFLGNEEKEKEKRKEEEAREAAKKAKSKLAKPVDKSHDNTRLDVLQTTMEGGRGRESVVIDRSDLKLEEERKKESSRKSSGGDSKKDKETSLFSSIFGGAKKKGDRESLGKKISSRGLSPEPPRRQLKPDIDYNWTRFSILEERAIYRMAHLKLANPKRALYSQVLLSNFMYSYLAKVQQMHPMSQLPQSAAQKVQQRQQQQQAQQQQMQQQQAQRKVDQPEEYYQYQKYQEQQQLQQQQQEQVQAQVSSHGNPHQHQSTSYVDDAETYNHDHGEHDNRHRPQSRTSQHSNHSLPNGHAHHAHASGSQPHRGQNGSPSSQPSVYQYPPAQFDDSQRQANEDMW
ncbi:MAG: hypothetical protein Q9187_002220 [Circinaria calcarea]